MGKFFSSLALQAVQFLPLLIHKQQVLQPEAPGPVKEAAVLTDLSASLSGILGPGIGILTNPAKLSAVKKLIAAIVTFKNEMAAAAAAVPAVPPTPPTI
jgi:hypothetical protein